MSEARLARARATLPAGYQFGDAGKIYRPDGALLARGNRLVLNLPERWRAPHLNAADRLARHAGWNVIEGEHFDSDADRHRTREGAES